MKGVECWAVGFERGGKEEEEIVGLGRKKKAWPGEKMRRKKKSRRAWWAGPVERKKEKEWMVG